MPDPADLSTDDPRALALVHDGWQHLQRQQPLAAWASWQRALRLVPEFPAAARALGIFANAGDLPEAARTEYRFFAPLGDDCRLRWDRALRGRDLADLGAAAAAFAALAEVEDGRAAFNQGLCLAWLGENAGGVEALERAAALAGATEPDLAMTAAALAEVVRQGAGAEVYADDLNRIATITWADPDLDTNPARFLDARPDVRALPNPVDPATGRPSRLDLDLFEWLDGPDLAAGGSTDRTSAPARRLLATVIRGRTTLRLSNADPNLLERAVAEVVRVAGPRVARIDREASPLPLAFLDAAVWSVRLARGLEPAEVDRLNRETVELFYESTWLHQPRHGLDGLTPLAAADRARAGDEVIRARLLGVVRVREQLGSRPSAVLLYQGYPFDRLRRRLGLATVDPEAVDPLDPSAMGAADLDALDPAALEGIALLDAFRSADALGDDPRTARFAARIAASGVEGVARLRGHGPFDLAPIIAVLVRQALADDDVDGALGRVDQAIAADLAATGGREAIAFTTWRAEILARSGQPDAALATYRQVLGDAPAPGLALDAAETMLDNDHDDHARTLARLALDRARQEGDHSLADRAAALL